MASCLGDRTCILLEGFTTSLVDTAKAMIRTISAIKSELLSNYGAITVSEFCSTGMLEITYMWVKSNGPIKPYKAGSTLVYSFGRQ
jgi:hypothetical protein